MAALTGRVEIVVNGQRIFNKEGAAIMNIGPGDGSPALERTSVKGDTGTHGIKDVVMPARLEVTITDRSDVSLGLLWAINGNGTVYVHVLTGGGGKTYIMKNAACMNPGSVTTGEGDTPLAFEAVDGGGWIEQTPHLAA